MGSSVVLLSDQLPVPSQQGLRRDNAGHLAKSLSSQCLGLYGQSPTLIVIEAHSPATELFSKHPILLAQVFNDLQLAVVHPPGDGNKQKPEWVEHSLRIQNSLSRPPSRSSEISHLHADPVFGPCDLVAFGHPSDSSLSNHVNRLDALQDPPRRPERWIPSG